MAHAYLASYQARICPFLPGAELFLLSDERSGFPTSAISSAKLRTIVATDASLCGLRSLAHYGKRFRNFRAFPTGMGIG